MTQTAFSIPRQISHLINALGLVLLAILPSFVRAGDADVPSCDESWDIAVSMVEDELRPVLGEIAYIFVDHDGRAYDCLAQGINPDFLTYLSAFLYYPGVLRGDYLVSDGSGDWPSSLCNIIEIGDRPREYVAITLPLAHQEWTMERCHRRLKPSIESYREG